MVAQPGASGKGSYPMAGGLGEGTVHFCIRLKLDLELQRKLANLLPVWGSDQHLNACQEAQVIAC